MKREKWEKKFMIHEDSLPHGAIVPEEVKVCIRNEAVFVRIPKPQVVSPRLPITGKDFLKRHDSTLT